MEWNVEWNIENVLWFKNEIITVIIAHVVQGLLLPSCPHRSQDHRIFPIDIVHSLTWPINSTRLEPHSEEAGHGSHYHFNLSLLDGFSVLDIAAIGEICPLWTNFSLSHSKANALRLELTSVASSLYHRSSLVTVHECVKIFKNDSHHWPAKSHTLSMRLAHFKWISRSHTWTF